MFTDTQKVKCKIEAEYRLREDRATGFGHNPLSAAVSRFHRSYAHRTPAIKSEDGDSQPGYSS